MTSLKTNKKFIIFAIIFCIGIFCFHTSISSQTYPWSWILGTTLPDVNLAAIATGAFPPSDLYPTAVSVPGSVPLPYPIDCTVGSVTGLSLDQEFGPGTSEITHCLIFKYGIKVLVQINKFESRPGRAYALGNIASMVDNYIITNGTGDFDIVAVVHSSGAGLLLNRFAATPHPDAALNIYQEQVEDLLAKGVRFFLCQNSARSSGIKTFHLIPGVQYVTSGGTAIVDFQRADYKMFQP